MFNSNGVMVNEIISGLASIVTIYDSNNIAKSIRFHSFSMRDIEHNYHHENYNELNQSLEYLASDFTVENIGLVKD